MEPENGHLVRLHEEYIKDTPIESLVANLTVLTCEMTNEVTKEIGVQTNRVYITSRTLKHLYDKKPAQEYDAIVTNLISIVRYPDHIYANNTAKRGCFCFYKQIDSVIFFCSIEKDGPLLPNFDILEANFVVTCFIFRNKQKEERYLKNYKLLWSWKGDNPS